MDLPSNAASQGGSGRETPEQTWTPTPACRALAGLCGRGEPTASWHMGLCERPVDQARTQLGPAPRAACGAPSPGAKAVTVLSERSQRLREPQRLPQTPASTAAPLAPSLHQLAEAPGQRSRKCGFRGVNNTSRGPSSRRQSCSLPEAPLKRHIPI